MLTMTEAVSQGLDSRFDSEQGLYGTLDDIPVVAQKGHYRRMELLEQLDVGDVSGKVCVDFGTGSWGFAGIYPKLHDCGFAYGLDISPKALEQSAKLSQDHPFPYGDNFEYLQSDGMDLPLPDGSVDVMFSGESIEHVRLPGRFLSECHRVLKSGSQIVITTPNRDALLYKIQNDEYCVGPEHFWLFNLEELEAAVSEFFDIRECVGFNGSIYRDLDKTSMDPEATDRWARLFADQPEFGTGIIMRAVKKPNPHPKKYETTTIDPAQVSFKGRMKVLDLEFGLKGRMIDNRNSKIEFTCPPCDGLLVRFWTHQWSGGAQVRCGEQLLECNLWSKDPGWKPVHFVLNSDRDTPVEISPTKKRDPRALASQVIFYEAFVYRG